MRTADAIRVLEQDEREVFTAGDLRALFPEKSEKTFTGDLARLVAQGVLTRAARGVHVNERKLDIGNSPDRIALALRGAFLLSQPSDGAQSP